MEPLLERLGRGETVVGDGAWGTLLMERGLEPGRCPETFNLTRPEVIERIHDEYLEAGCDIVTTNTFGATSVAQRDYGLETAAYEINLEGARIARRAAYRWTEKTPEQPRFVAGSIGPTSKTLSLSPDVNDPGYRAILFDDLKSLPSCLQYFFIRLR